MPDPDNLAAFPHTVLLLDQRTAGSIEIRVRHQFQLNDPLPLGIAPDERSLGWPRFDENLLNPIENQFTPMAARLGFDVATDRPPKTIVQEGVGEDAMSSRRLRARRPIEDIDLANFPDRANDRLENDAVELL